MTSSSHVKSLHMHFFFLASRNLRRSVWLAWRQYVAARRQQQAQLCRAQLWSNGCRLRWAWGVWRRTVNFNVQRIAADILAVRHWGHSLQRKVCGPGHPSSISYIGWAHPLLTVWVYFVNSLLSGIVYLHTFICLVG